MYLFIDTETGGLTPQYSLLTVSCILADKDFNIVPVDDWAPGLHLKVQHEEYALTAGALKVNKINIAEHHENSVPLSVAEARIHQYIQRARALSGKQRLVPAGHNVAFDVQFLRAYLLDNKSWDSYFTYPVLDTAVAARFLNAAGLFSGGYSLTALQKKLIPHLGALDMHDAEVDNLVAIELAKKFVSMLPTQNT